MKSNKSSSLCNACTSVLPSHTVIQAHAASMEKVLMSISSEGRVTDPDRDRELKRSASLPQVVTFRSSLRRFLTRSNSFSPAPPTRAPRWSGGSGKAIGSASNTEGSHGQRGGMSVLLMSQELHLEGNQADFLKKFTTTQASASNIFVSVCLYRSHFCCCVPVRLFAYLSVYWSLHFCVCPYLSQ